MTMVMINGHLEPADRATVPALDRGLTQGLGLYETLKLIGGAPAFYPEHMARMQRGLATLHIDLPDSIDDVAHQIAELSRAADVPDGACRVLVTAGPPEGRPTVLIQVDVRQFPDHPLDLVTYHALRSTADMKSKSFTTSFLATRAAKEAGADDALFVDEEGRAHEATTANLLVQTDGRLLTPPLDGSILPGVIRTKMVELRAEAGKPIDEEHILARELGPGDAVFLTSSVRGIVAARSLDGRSLMVDDDLLAELRLLLGTAEAASAERFRTTYA